MKNILFKVVVCSIVAQGTMWTSDKQSSSNLELSENNIGRNGQSNLNSLRENRVDVFNGGANGSNHFPSNNTESSFHLVSTYNLGQGEQQPNPKEDRQASALLEENKKSIFGKLTAGVCSFFSWGISSKKETSSAGSSQGNLAVAGKNETTLEQKSETAAQKEQ